MANYYGQEKEDQAFDINDPSINVYGNSQFIYERKGDKTYIYLNGVEDDIKIVAIVDNSTTYGELEEILRNAEYDQSLRRSNSNDYVNHTYGETTDSAESIIAQIEKDTGKTVESITFRDGKCEIVIDGEKHIVDYEEGKGDKVCEEVKKSVESNPTYTAADKIDEENKKVLENYLKQYLPEDEYDAEIVLNEDGTYEIKINGKTLRKLDKDATLGDGIAAINEELSSGKSLSEFSKSQETYRLQNATGQNYKIHIDVDRFNRVMEYHDNSLTSMESVKGLYTTSALDGELLTYYDTVVAANTDPTERIDKTSELLTNIVTNVDYSLQAYENIDHNLGIVINSIIGEIFSLNSYMDPETKEFYDRPLEERKIYLANLIQDYETQLEQLKNEYEEKYGYNDLLFNSDFANLLYGIINGLGLGDSIVRNKYEVMDLSAMSDTFDFIIENDVFNKLYKYSSGQSWKESGMGDIPISCGTAGYAPADRAEALFLQEYLSCQTSDREFIEEYYKNCNGKTYWDDIQNNESAINCLKNRIFNQLSTTRAVTVFNEDTLSEEVKNLNAADLTSYLLKNEKELRESIQSLSNTIYNYKQYEKIMPFEGDMSTKEYLDYLVRDYSNTTDGRLKYLDQKELALYTMFKETGRNSEAEGYLKAMEDLINQRKGYEEAALRIMEYGGIDGFLRSGWDGFKDGIEGFFNNIGHIWDADGIRSAEDYRNMFMLSLLGEENIYNKGLSPVNREILKANYQIMSSVGQQAIPTLAYFIPGVGKVLSPILQAAAAFGASTESAMQSGASSARAYLYGALSGVSTAVLNRCLSGIAGLNGNTAALDTLQGYLKGMGQQAVRTLLGTYLDGGLRSVILGEPFDISKLTEQGFEAAIQGAFTAAIMNGTNKVLLTIANGVTIAVTGSSYQEFCANVEQKMWDSSIGKKVLALKAAGGKIWEDYCKKHPNSLLVQAVQTYQYNHSADMPINIDDETARKMGIKLGEGEHILYDPNTNNYQKVDANGNVFVIPASDINDYEGQMYIKLTEEEQFYLRAKQDGVSPSDSEAMWNYSESQKDAFLAEAQKNGMTPEAAEEAWRKARNFVLEKLNEPHAKEIAQKLKDAGLYDDYMNEIFYKVAAQKGKSVNVLGEMLKAMTDDPELKAQIDQLYRGREGNNYHGDGGSADAVRSERTTGSGVDGTNKTHQTKVDNGYKFFEKRKAAYEQWQKNRDNWERIQQERVAKGGTYQPFDPNRKVNNLRVGHYTERDLYVLNWLLNELDSVRTK